MGKRILIIDGHPDPAAQRFVHALAESYRASAVEAEHEVRLLRLSQIEFELLRSNDEYLKGVASPSIASAQIDLRWCEHLVLMYPLWLGAMPALVKGFLEQVLRPGFAFDSTRRRGLPKRLLEGRSARIVVTMGMPTLFYKWFYRAHSLKSLERNILKFVGFGPVRASVIGSVESSQTYRAAQLQQLSRLAKAGR